jgi:GNAT superfamily N-acetyltransferase
MTLELTIRIATRDEKELREDLQWRASLVWEEYREALLAHPDTLELPLAHLDTGHTYVAERGGQILGFSVVVRRADGDADLDGLFVEPAIWKHGAGRRLVQQAERLAASRGSEWLYVIANPRARGFYQACAFEPLGEEQTPFGWGPPAPAHPQLAGKMLSPHSCCCGVTARSLLRQSWLR